MMIDDKDSFLARFATEITFYIAISWFGGKLSGPSCRECCAVQLLITLCACGNIGSARGPLVMDNFAQRLIEHLVAILPHVEREVGILVISRHVSRIETTNALKQRF